MASITISPVHDKSLKTTSVTGGEKILVISQEGKPATIEVNQIIDKLDDDIVGRIDDQVIEKIEGQIDDIIDDRLENVDPNNNLKWNDV